MENAGTQHIEIDAGLLREGQKIQLGIACMDMIFNMLHDSEKAKRIDPDGKMSGWKTKGA